MSVCNASVLLLTMNFVITLSMEVVCGSTDSANSGLDFRKKTLGLDLVASTNFLVAKKFSALRAKDFYLKISFDTVKLRLLSLLLSPFSRITLICQDFFSSKEKET